MFKHPAYGGMAGFMICNGLFFILGNDLVLLFKTTHNPVNGIKKILFLNRFFIFSCGNQGSFIAYIGNICTGETRSLTCKKIHNQVLFCFDGPADEPGKFPFFHSGRAIQHRSACQIFRP